MAVRWWSVWWCDAEGEWRRHRRGADLAHTLVGCAGVWPTQPVESGPHAGCLAGGVRSREAAHAGWM